MIFNNYRFFFILFLSFLISFPNFNKKLSDYNIYSSDPHNLMTTSNYITYELITPLFSDYAYKHRSIFIPKNKKIKYFDKRVFEFPVGTIIYDESFKEKVADLSKDNQEFVVAKGGKGGSGNLRFKSSTNRSPRKITQGKEGGSLSLRLELRLLADVGLLGRPNSGKSSLVKAVSSANPKIADYEFTTLKPSLGVVDYSTDKSFVISDIPGLITGASKGIGLGFQFLKHLSRTRLVLLLIDVDGKESKEIEEESQDLLRELNEYDNNLADKVKWLVLNKMDLISKEKQMKLKEYFDEQKDLEVCLISAKNRQGTENLMKEVGYKLEKIDE